MNKNKMVVRVDFENIDSIKDKIEELSKYAERQYNKAIDDFADSLAKYLGVENATKYGNKNAEQQRNSYDTLMKYEIADSIEDVAEQLKEGGENEQSIFEKIIEKLEEEKSNVPVNRLLDDIIKDKPKELGQLIAYNKAIAIVKQEAEQYNNGLYSNNRKGN